MILRENEWNLDSEKNEGEKTGKVYVFIFCICIRLTPRRHSLGHIEAVLLDIVSAATHGILA